MHDTRVCATSCVKYFVKRRLNDLCKCYVMLAKHSVELFSQKKKKMLYYCTRCAWSV